MKHNTKKQILRIIGACTLCAAMIVGAVAGVLLNIHPKTNNVSTEEAAPLVLSTFVETGVHLSAGTAVASSDGTLTQNLTATVDEEAAKTLPFTWSVAFKNASSAWAKGKNVTDYVTVTKSSTDQLKATVTCKKAFGEQIIVTVKSDYGSASASCTVDYIKRLDHCTLKLICDSSDYSVILDSNYSGQDTDKNEDEEYTTFFYSKTEDRTPQYTVNYEITYTDGTISPEVSVQFGEKIVKTVGQTITFNAMTMNEYSFDVQSIFSVDLLFDGKMVCYWDCALVPLVETLTLNETSIVF